MSRSKSRKIHSSVTEGKPNAALWKLAAPMMAGAVMHNLFNLVDLFFVGRLGVDAVAALSISGAILAVLIMAAIGIATGTTALVSHFTGKKDYLAADNALFQTIILSIVCSAGIALIGLFGTVPLLTLFGAPPEIIPAASQYLKILFVGSIFIFLGLGFNYALRGAGDVIFPLKVLFVANLLNIVLDPLLIFGVWVFPRMGVGGAALATVISRAIGLAVILRHVIWGHSSLRLEGAALRINIPVITRMVKIGFFASFEVLLRQLSLLLLLRLITSYGTAALAAYGIVSRLRLTIVMLGMGMGVASAVLIGQNMGADKPERATRFGMQTLKHFEFLVIPIAVLFFIFAPQMVRVFSADPDVVTIASGFLRCVAVTIPFLSSTLVLGKGIGGAGDTLTPAMMTGIAQLGLRVPIAYALALACGLGPMGIWLGINASDICQGSAMLWYFRQGYWQKRYYHHRALLDKKGGRS